MADFATTTDVESAWRTLTDAENLVATSGLEFVSAIIRSLIPTVDARIADGTLDAVLVKHVAVAAVLRHLRNPDGKQEERIEDYAYVRDSALAAGSFYLSDDELSLLRARRRAFSIVPSIDPPDGATLERAALLQSQWNQ